jgi:hypothetical protein
MKHAQRKERLSHIDDFNMDPALGLFAGLNESGGRKAVPQHRLEDS